MNDELPDGRPVDDQTDVEQPLSRATLTNTCVSPAATTPTYVIVVRQEGDTWVGRWEAGNGNTEADTLEECLANMAEVITLIQDDDDE